MNDFEPISIQPKELGCLLGLSTITIRRHIATGKTPKPNRLGRRLLWNRKEIIRWYEAGMPSRVKWEAMKEMGVD